MKDAISGVFTIQFILVFIVIVSSYLAFTVTYSHAVRMKNHVVTIIEQFEGITNPEVCARIDAIAEQAGYGQGNRFSNISCPEGQEQLNCPRTSGICVGSSSLVRGEHNLDRVEYHVTTFISTDLPFLNRILPTLGIFQSSGTTRTITRR